MANVSFKFGTKLQYDALPIKDDNTLYWLTDTSELMKGDICFGKGAEATSQASGLLSAADKIHLDALVSAGTISNLQPVDASIVITDAENSKTVGVQISNAAGNSLELKSDGLYASAGAGGGVHWEEM